MTFVMIDQWQQQFDLHLCATSDYFSYTTHPVPEQHSKEVDNSYITPSASFLGGDLLVKTVAASPSLLVNNLGYQTLESNTLCSMLDASFPHSLAPSSGPTSSYGDCPLVSPTSSTASSWVERSSSYGPERDASEIFDSNGVASLPISQLTSNDSFRVPSLVCLSEASSKVVPMGVKDLSLPPISQFQECYSFYAGDTHPLVSQVSQINYSVIENSILVSECRGLCCAAHRGDLQRCDHVQSNIYGSPPPAPAMESQSTRFRQQKSSHEAKMGSESSSGAITINTKRFPCPECGQRFARAFNLQTHVSTHAGLRPFSCPAAGCSKAFSRRHDLGRHLNAVHRDWLVTNGLSATEAIKPAPRKPCYKKSRNTHRQQSSSASG